MPRRLPLSGEGPMVAFARDLRELQERDRGTVEAVVARGASRSAVYAALRGDRLPSARTLDCMVDVWNGDGEPVREQWHERRRAVEEALAEAARVRGEARAGRTGEEEEFTRELRALWERCGSPSTELLSRHCDLSARTLDSYLDGRTIPTDDRLRAFFEGLATVRSEDRAWLSAARDTMIGETLFRARTARQQERSRVRELASVLPGGQPSPSHGPLPDGIGNVPGVRLGQRFESRQTLAEAGVHRPRMAGISGTPGRGAESVLVAGGLPDDEDHGDVIVYTGEGGRDPRDGSPVRDQQLSRGNGALAASAATGAPVRVIRLVDGSPRSHYRYDGLFRVEDYWSEVGAEGFLRWRFRLVRLPSAEQAGAGAAGTAGAAAEEERQDEPRARSVTTVQRVVRNTAVANLVKRAHDHTCQICGVRLDTPSGAYAEAAHIMPLGRPYNGQDTIDNVLCLCPNHHLLFDHGMVIVNDDLTVVSRADSTVVGRLREVDGHRVDRRLLADHRVRHGLPEGPSGGTP